MLKRSGLLLLALSSLALAASATEPAVLPSVLEPAGTGGYAALDRALGKLATHRRMLVIGAHPDDEDTAALTTVSRAQDGEAAYLSLSRGDGGQNLVGPDLGEALGVLRTRELLAARGIDGGRQYFTRAFDFGYTRSLEETLGKWPEAVLLEDAVRVIRRFKPQVILSIFGNDASGGHGQHQAAGHTAFLAFARSADAALLAGESEPPWKASSLYRTGWFEPEMAKVKVELGVVDPWSGFSMLQIAQRSRSQHSSQDMGRLYETGKRVNSYRFVEGAGSPEGTDLFAGIDTSLAGIAAPMGQSPGADAIRLHLRKAEERAKAARAALRPDRLDLAIEPLLAALSELDAAHAAALAVKPLAAAMSAAMASLIAEKIAIGEQALLVAAGVAIDASTDAETFVPGATAKVAWTVWNSGRGPVTLSGLGFAGFVDTAGSGDFEPEVDTIGELAPGASQRVTRPLRIGETAPVTRPYFLERPRKGDLYDWSGTLEADKDEPFQPGPLRALFALTIGGRLVNLEREVVYRFADQAKGEIRRPLRIVPPLEIEVSPEVVVWPAGAKAPEVQVRLASRSDRPLSGAISFQGGCGGKAAPTAPFELGARDATTLRIAVPACAPAKGTAGDPPYGGGHSGRSRFSLVAEAGGVESAAAAPLLVYPHVPPTPMRGSDGFDLVRAEIALPAVKRVGYVMGVSDRVPGLLAAAGVPIEILDAADLAANDFARFDAIVVGSRAYETDLALQKANPHLLDYVKKGGLLLVQYQQYPYIDGGYAPYPLRIERPHDRITDETSPVRLLVPDHPAFTTPNRLSDRDWQGWVQERALYMPATWDAAYEPLLELQDPDEPARRGALLVAPFGEGTYVYTGIAFFRELPAGVAGAYRLFANLLGLGGVAAERAASFAERGRELAHRFLIVDTHVDVPERLDEKMADIAERTAEGDFDYPRAVEGGLDAPFLSIYVPAKYQEKSGAEGARAYADKLIDMVEGIVAKNPEKWALARTPDEVLALRAAGKIAFPMGMENAAGFEDDVANVGHFYDRGVRYATLTHGKNNLIGDSSYEKKDHRQWHGLSPFGREVVAEMNRLGMLVDLSHVSDETFDAALAATKAPPVVSHSSCRFFTPGWERNLDDARIAALAKKGGVLQISFGSAFLTKEANENSTERLDAVEKFVKEKGVADDSPEAKAFEAQWKKENPLPRATLDDVVAHIDHVVKLVGVDHVGLGSDFEGVGDSLPEGLRDVSMYPYLFARLLARGYSEADIEKIAGGNTIRVWREAERVAKELQSAAH